jgi:DNA polymerase-3 subunit delta
MPAAAAKPDKADKPATKVPLLLLSGDDDLAIKQKALATFTEWCSSAGGFDEERISATAANSSDALNALGKLREALQTLPFFGAKTIWFQNCNFLGTDRTSESAAVTESLASLADDLKKFNWSGVRLLITADSIDKRKSFYKTISKLGSVEEMNGWSIEDRDWADQAEMSARQQLRAAGKKFSEEALARLVNDAGVNNRHLTNEIEKLVLFLGSKEEATTEDIEAIVSRSRQSRAFALADAVGARSLPKLVRTLDTELHDMRSNSKKSEIGLLYGIISKVRAMLFAKEMVRVGWLKAGAGYDDFKRQLSQVPASELPQDKKFNPLSMHPFMLHGAFMHSQKYTMTELIAAMEALLQANLQLISTGLDEALILQQTLIRIVQPASSEPGTTK